MVSIQSDRARGKIGKKEKEKYELLGQNIQHPDAQTDRDISQKSSSYNCNTKSFNLVLPQGWILMQYLCKAHLKMATWKNVNKPGFQNSHVIRVHWRVKIEKNRNSSNCVSLGTEWIGLLEELHTWFSCLLYCCGVLSVLWQIKSTIKWTFSVAKQTPHFWPSPNSITLSHLQENHKSNGH